MNRTQGCSLFLVLAVLLGSNSAGLGQEVQVYRRVTPDKLEALLKKLNLEVKKTSDAKKEGVHFYTYIRKNNVFRIHNYQGQDLWIDVVFNDPLKLEDVNRWNVAAKFSRAVLVKADEKSSVSLESQLDCLGGVHDAMIALYIRRFESEVERFEKFLSK